MAAAGFTVGLATLGCKVNQCETDAIAGLFAARGYNIVDFSASADIYVINTCSVTSASERKSRQLIRRARRANPSAVIAITGCFAQLAPEAVRQIPGVSVVVGTQGRDRIVDIVEQAIASHRSTSAVADIAAAREFEDIPYACPPSRTRGFLKIQEGCRNYCTYCIIPYTRGPLRSRSLNSVTQEAAKLVAGGTKEIVLTGIHLGAYGVDFGDGTTLADAVRAVLKIPGMFRLRLSSIEATEVDAELIALIKEDRRVCRHLHLPLQSGDDATLKLMNRNYTVVQFQEKIETIRREIPEVAVTTDIIAGFPGESEEAFRRTIDFVQAAKFARLHVFPYSVRPGTPAANFPDQVPDEVKRERAKELQKVGRYLASAYAARFVGTETAVLYETADGPVIDGLTDNYIRVFAATGSLQPGDLRNTRLIRPFRDGLWGELV